MAVDSTTQAEPSRGSRVGRAIGQVLRGILRLILFIVLIAILVAGGWVGYQELNRSFASVRRGTELNAERIELLRDDMQGVMTTLPEYDTQLREVDGVLGTVGGRLDGVDERLVGVEGQLAEDLARQAEVLTALETEVGGLIASTGVLTEHVATMAGEMTAMHDEMVAGEATLAELGGEIAAVELSLADEAARLEAGIIDPAGQLADMQQLLILFRSWELVSRARLHLLQGNGGLATADLAVAVDTLDVLVAGNETEVTDRLLVARQRMLLAIDSLPNDPVTASRDLESAWEVLDEVLGTLLGLETEAVPEETDP